MNYVPKVGDSVAAWRKIKSGIYHNLVVGPVVSTFDNGCRVQVISGLAITDFELFYSDWRFDFLHRTSEATDEALKQQENEIVEKVANRKKERAKQNES